MALVRGARGRVSALVAAALVAGLAGCTQLSGGGAGSCASPIATATPAEVAPGGEVTVSVDGLIGDCYDTGQGGPNPPLRGAEVTLHYADGTHSDVLATVTSDADLHAAFTVTVPADAVAGTASVLVGAQALTEVTIAG